MGTFWAMLAGVGEAIAGAVSNPPRRLHSGAGLAGPGASSEMTSGATSEQTTEGLSSIGQDAYKDDAKSAKIRGWLLFPSPSLLFLVSFFNLSNHKAPSFVLYSVSLAPRPSFLKSTVLIHYHSFFFALVD